MKPAETTILLLTVLCGLGSLLGACAYAQEIIHLGDRRELFVDGFLVDRMEGVELKPHTPQPAPPASRPLSGPGTYGGYVYGTVFADGDIFRFYGRRDVKGQPQVIVYAHSRDGINWEEPNLGIFDVPWVPAGNVVMHGAQEYPVHNFTPFLDARPDVPAQERYKGLGGAHVKRGVAQGQGADNQEQIYGGGLRGYVSADGIRWRAAHHEAIIPNDWGMFDSQNLAFWSEFENCYVCYFRVFDNKLTPGVRSVRRSTSSDFIHWTSPVDVRINLPRPGGPNQYGHQYEQLYVPNIKPYFRAPHIYIALPARTNFDRNAPNDILLAVSRDGINFERCGEGAYLRPGEHGEYTNRGHYLAHHVIQTGPREMSLYNYQGRRWTLRLDGFASAHAPFAGGQLVTKPLVFAGSKLQINAQTAGSGFVQIEVLDTDGHPIGGFRAADAVPFNGDDVSHVVAWRDGTDVSGLAGRAVRLRLVMKDADVFSLRFTH